MEIDKELVEKIEEIAPKLKACGHHLRLKILCAIESRDVCVTDLWECFGQSQPVVSQHLAVLKRKGIVESTVQGNKRIYTIVDPFIERLIRDLIKKEEK